MTRMARQSPSTPKERAWEVLLFCTDEPSNVSIGGVETFEWTYDEQLRRLAVRVPTRPCSDETVIHVSGQASSLQDKTGNQIEMRYNAASEHLVVSCKGPFLLHICDVQGRQVMEGRWTDGNRINLSSLPRGEYICNCRAGRATMTRKILKP